MGTFFRTNRNTCLEWLSRIRLSALSVAEHAGRHAVVVRHAYEALTDTGITQVRGCNRFLVSQRSYLSVIVSLDVVRFYPAHHIRHYSPDSTEI